MRNFIIVSLGTALLAGCTVGQAQEAATPTAEPAELGEVIALRAANECRFDPRTDHAFEGLLLMGWEPREVTHAPQIAIGETMYTPQFSDTEMEGTGWEDIPNGREYRSSIDLAAGSTWHGLPISGMFVEFFAPPETDSLYRRGLRFSASTEELRGALAEQGHQVPVAPDFLTLDEFSAFAAQTCGGAMFIEPTEDGSLLVCDRGC